MQTIRNQRDPTKTTSLRAKFSSEGARRWREMRGWARAVILEENQYDWANPSRRESVPTNIDNFKTDMNDQMDQLILGIPQNQQSPRGMGREAWTDPYIRESYVRGVRQADVDMRKNDLPIPPDDTEDLADNLTNVTHRNVQQRQFAVTNPALASSMSVQMDEAFNDLDAAAAQTAKEATRQATRTLRQNGGATSVLDAVQDRFEKVGGHRTNLLSRTSIVRAHNEALLDRYEQMGVEEVGIMAEWLTAGDFRVCPRCQGNEGRTFTIEEARGLIPLHPLCRCRWIMEGTREGKSIQEISEEQRQRWMDRRNGNGR